MLERQHKTWEGKTTVGKQHNCWKGNITFGKLK